MKILKRRMDDWLEGRRLDQTKFLPNDQQPKDAIHITEDEWYPEDDIYEQILSRGHLVGSRRV
ncbi:hypothetical protein [Staphylospora marina]|uniref:hypothetical protein n=1 Tax=Staphylospora marina TaxID=2490858 RepID=UPI0013DE27BE|nr:hypothetical protein [Staphylospora marina]